MANYLHSTPTPLDVDPPLAPHGGRPRVWLRRPPRSAPLTSSDSQLCEHGERERKLLLTHRSSALPPSLSLSSLSLSPSKFDNFDLSHSYPSGGRGEARWGTFSYVCVCVCVCVRASCCRGIFVVVDSFTKLIRHCRHLAYSEEHA